MDSRSLGRWGEEQAAKYLKLRGYRVFEMNYKCRGGEIDIIARKGKFIVFVEVKLRKSSSFADAKDFVDVFKQDRLRTTAEFYLSKYPTKLQPRFDVIEIYAPDGVETKKPDIIHLEDAFA